MWGEGRAADGGSNFYQSSTTYKQENCGN